MSAASRKRKASAATTSASHHTYKSSASSDCGGRITGRRRTSAQLPKAYEVESIVDWQCDEHDDLWYLIKWKNFSSKHNTWCARCSFERVYARHHPHWNAFRSGLPCTLPAHVRTISHTHSISTIYRIGSPLPLTGNRCRTCSPAPSSYSKGSTSTNRSACAPRARPTVGPSLTLASPPNRRRRRRRLKPILRRPKPSPVPPPPSRDQASYRARTFHMTNQKQLRCNMSRIYKKISERHADFCSSAACSAFMMATASAFSSSSSLALAAMCASANALAPASCRSR